MKYSIVAALAGLLVCGTVASTEVHLPSSSVYERAAAIGAPIRSKEQLYAYLSVMPDSPLHKLGHVKLQSFLDSLTFTEAGLGSYSYIELEGMSSTDIYRILSLFGAQADAGTIRRSANETDRDIEALLKHAQPNRDRDFGCWVRPGVPLSKCHPDSGHRCAIGCGG